MGDEVGALERLRNNIGAARFDQSMWDMSMFHPSIYGHEQLASEAHRCTAQNWPELSALAPHPEVSNSTTTVEQEKNSEEAERKKQEETERKKKEEAERSPQT